ncbi:unnamed protein product [Aphanomyces euteiches]
MITSEKRFGPKFSTGREEEPSPLSYSLPSTFQPKPSKTPTVGFGSEPRLKSPPTRKADFGAYNLELPGAFPNVYTAEQWESQQKLLLEETHRARISPRAPAPRLQLAAGPGSYNTDSDILKTGHECRFSKAKRLDMTEYIESLGQVGASPEVSHQDAKVAKAHVGGGQIHRESILMAAASPGSRRYQAIWIVRLGDGLRQEDNQARDVWHHQADGHAVKFGRLWTRRRHTLWPWAWRSSFEEANSFSVNYGDGDIRARNANDAGG